MISTEYVDISLLKYEDGLCTIMSYNLSHFLGCGRDSIQAQEKVRESVYSLRPSLEVEYDSEIGCFFAYLDSLQDAMYLMNHILGMIENAKV